MATLSRDAVWFFHYDEPISNTSTWDRRPLVVILDQDNRTMLGVNIHHLPNNKVRRDFVETVIDLSRRLPRRKLVQIVYGMILSSPLLQPAKSSSIRRYIKKRMKNVTKVTKEQLRKFDTGKRFPITLLNRKYKKKIARRR